MSDAVHLEGTHDSTELSDAELSTISGGDKKQPTAPTGGVNVHDIHVTKQVDLTSPKIG